MKTKKKNQKPTSIDAHLKYKCPEPDCGFDHWISLKEAQTKNFKIVCDCGKVFSPKRIKELNISYYKKPKTPKLETVEIKEANETKQKLSLDLLNGCVKILVGYGFTKDESVVLCKKAFSKNACDDAPTLARYILKNIGELDECN